MALTLGDLWKALRAEPWPWEKTVSQPFADVVVDSRLAVKGSLFVALPGERMDGHLFVSDAFRRGAQAALVQRPVDDCVALVDVGQRLDARSPVSLPPCSLERPLYLAPCPQRRRASLSPGLLPQEK